MLIDSYTPELDIPTIKELSLNEQNIISILGGRALFDIPLINSYDDDEDPEGIIRSNN